MPTVERHAVDAPFAADNAPKLAASFARNLPKVTGSTRRLTTLLDTALLRLGSQCAVDPAADKLDTWVSFTHATQASTAIFFAATAVDDTVDCLIDQQWYTIARDGAAQYADPVRWQAALWLSVIARDFHRMRMLVDVGESTLRASSGGFDEYVYAWIATLRAYFSDDGAAEVPGKLQQTAGLIAPEHTGRSHPDRIRCIVGPELLLFLELASRDEAGFNRQLNECLQAHQEFWTVDRRARTDPLGYLALAPLAMACAARDIGFTLDVESDYLPRHLIQGSWISEFQF